MATAADLLIRVTADVNAAAANLNSLKGDVGALSTSLGTTNADRLKQSLEDAHAAGVLLAGIGAAIALAFVNGVKTASDFEKEMSAVKSLLSPTEVQQFGKALEDLAIALGADTGLTVTTKEAAAGIEELIKAGVPAQAVLDGAAKAAIALANATGITVADAATFASTAMNAFKLKASDLLHVMDVLAGTANATAADMNDLKFGFASVSAVAHMMGMSVEETSLALGIFANAGLRGMDAGTSLKTMLLNLQPSTKKASELMKELGIITAKGTNLFFDQTGKVKDLSGIHQVLVTALKGESDAQAVATLKQLFGTDAVRAASIIYSTSAREIDRNRDAILGLSVLDMAKTRVDNAAGAWEIFNGAVEAVSIVIFRDFLPAIQSVLLFIGNIVSGFVTMDPTLRTVLTAIVGVAGAAAALSGAFILLGPMVIDAATAFSTILLPALGAALGPFLLVVAAAGALYLAFTNDWGGIATTFNNIAFALKNFLSGQTDLEGFILQLKLLNIIDLTGIQDTLESVFGTIGKLAFVIGNLVSGQTDLEMFAFQLRLLTGIDLSGLIAGVQGVGAAFGRLFQGDVSGFVEGLRSVWASIDWASVWAAATGLGSSLLSSGLSIVSSVAAWLAQQWAQVPWGTIWATAQAALAAAIAGAPAAIIDVWAVLFGRSEQVDASGATVVAEGIVGQLATAIQRAAGTLGTTLNALGLGAITQAFNDLAPTGQRIADAFNAIGAALQGVDFLSLIGQAQGMATGFGQAASQVDILKTAGDLLVGGLNALVSGINTVSGAIESVVVYLRDNEAALRALEAFIATIVVAWGAYEAGLLAIQGAQFAVTAATNGWAAAQALLNVLLAANPIGIVVVALAALVAGLVYAYNSSEDFRRVVDSVAVTLRDGLGVALPWIGARFQEFLGTVQAVVSWVSTNVLPVLGQVASFLRDALGAAIQRAVGDWQSFSSAVQVVSSWVGEHLIPLLHSVQGVMDAITNVTGRAFAGLWQNVILPSIQSVSNWFDANLAPAFRTINGLLTGFTGTASQASAGFREIDFAARNLGGFLDATLGPTWRTISGIFENTVLPALRSIWSVIATAINPLLQTMKEQWVDPLVTAWNNMGSYLDRAAGFFNDVAAAINNIQLPWFLTPGSPTPFELGLQGILGVLSKLASIGNPLSWLKEFVNLLWPNALGGGGGNGTGGGATGPITVNGPLVYIGGTSASAGDIVAAIQDAFEMLTDGGPSTPVAAPVPSAGGGGGGGGSW